MAGPQEQASRGCRIALGSYMVFAGFFLGYLVYAFWPTTGPDASGSVPPSTINLFGYHFTVISEIRSILLVMAVGAVGSYIHQITSFVDFVGNRRLYASWTWWYVLRPFAGLFLALLFYFTLRGGLLVVGAESDGLNAFGIAAIAGLVGMFSKQATDKLREVFDTAFKTSDQRADKLVQGTPKIASIDPQTVQHGSTGMSLTVTGEDFVSESVVKFNGADRPTKWISNTTLVATIPDADIAAPGTIEVTVFNPPPGGGTSNAATMTVT